MQFFAASFFRSVSFTRTRTDHTMPLKMPLQRHSRFIVLPILLCLVSFCAEVANAQFIVAHRGASHDAPENTLAAFRLAWEQHADAIEGDFYLSKDGQIVCIHDRTTKRTAPGRPELTVAQSTLSELRTLDVGSWKDKRFASERIPTLLEVLDTVPDGKRIFIEIKCGPEIVPVLKQHLQTSKLKSEQIVIICFNEEVVSQSRQTMPQYKANWLTSYKQATPVSAWKPTLDDVLRTLKRSGATGLGTNGNLKVIDQAFVDSIQAAGLEFHVWTVNEAKSAGTFKSLGVQSITTDRPAFIRNAE